MAAEGYRPWLDGIRTLSILLVIIEHGLRPLMPSWNYGGTGVGIFFVLSGYLITGLLLDEINKTGAIDLRRFYIRRVARLMPALLLLVIVFDVIFLACGMPNSIVASLLSVAYVSNYATVANGHYIPSFGHTWSLAVEEHFYFIWPLVLPWLVRRLPPQKVFHATLAFCIAVLVWRIVILQLGAPPRLLYVGSLERSDTLLYGALAAMAVRQGWRPHPALFYFGIALVLGQLILSDFDHVRPIALALGAAFAIVALDHCPLHRVRRLLSAVPMVWLGTVSYGIYLWHGTIFDFFHARGMTSMAYAPLAIGLSIAAAALSHRCLEMPVRQWARARTERVNAPSTGPVSRPLTLEPGSAAAKD